MPMYYPNPYSYTYPISYGSYLPNNNPVQNVPQQIPQQSPQYMINVDGENAAKSWQPTVLPQPNTIIPLFDSDGQHVYFKTFDAYGRMNPIRKGRIVFDEEIQISESAQPSVQDMSAYVTKDDLEKFKQEIINQIRPRNNQNGNNTRGDR